MWLHCLTVSRVSRWWLLHFLSRFFFLAFLSPLFLIGQLDYSRRELGMLAAVEEGLLLPPPLLVNSSSGVSSATMWHDDCRPNIISRRLFCVSLVHAFFDMTRRRSFGHVSRESRLHTSRKPASLMPLSDKSRHSTGAQLCSRLVTTVTAPQLPR